MRRFQEVLSLYLASKCPPLASGLERVPNQLIADNRDANGEGGGVGHKSSASDDYPILPGSIST